MNMKKRQRFRIFCFLLSWFLLAFGHPSYLPFLCYLAPISYGLLWFSLAGLDKKRICNYSFVFFFTAQLIQLSWMRSDFYQGIYTHFFLLILAAGISLLFMATTLLGLKAHSLKKGHLIWTSLYMASLGIAFELVRYLPFYGFTWNPIALPYASNLYSAQLASIGGVFFLSFLLLLTNALFFVAIYKRKRGAFALCLALALAPYLYGYHRINSEKLPAEFHLKVLVVGTNFYPYTGHHEDQMYPLDRWEMLLQALSPYYKEEIDLVVFPEGTVPFDLNKNVYPSAVFHSLRQSYLPSQTYPHLQSERVSNYSFVSSISYAMVAPVVAGIDVVDSYKKRYNAAIYCDGDFVSFYGKRSLLPIAEKIPFDFLKPIAKIYGIEDSYQEGEGPVIFNSPLPMSPSICYEESQTALMREGRVKGAQLFVNITNDVWYPESHLAEEHFIFSRLRAIENGIPIVRSCNSGVSGALNCFGELVARQVLPYSKEDAQALLISVPIKKINTVYAALGDFWLWGFAFLIIILERMHLHKYSFFKHLGRIKQSLLRKQ